jgi:hypothetical protein
MDAPAIVVAAAVCFRSRRRSKERERGYSMLVVESTLPSD